MPRPRTREHARTHLSQGLYMITEAADTTSRGALTGAVLYAAEAYGVLLVADAVPPQLSAPLRAEMEAALAAWDAHPDVLAAHCRRAAAVIAAETDAAYEYPRDWRAQWVREITDAAADRPGHATYARALAAYWATVAPGDDSGEPDGRGIRGLSQRAADALAADMANIHAARLPQGTYSSGYTRDYLTLRAADKRKAARAAHTRQECAQAAAGPLADLLALDTHGSAPDGH